jgi:hypothetical protein
MANRATKEHIILFVNTNENKHKPQQQKASDIVCKQERKKEKSKISQLNQRNTLMKQKTVCNTYLLIFASEGFSFCKYSLIPFV